MMANQESDSLEACLQIVSSHFDFGDLTDQAKHAFRYCMKGGPLLLVPLDEVFLMASSYLTQTHQEQQGSTSILEFIRSRVLEIQQTYEKLRAEAQRRGCSTGSHAFQEALLRLTALQLDTAQPDDELKSSLSLLEEPEVRRLLSDQPLLHNIYQWGLSLFAPAYPYRPLNPAVKEIRVLVLLPSTEPSAMVECQLVHSSPIKNLLYAALSYVWGTSEPRATIVLEGKSFTVTTNLYSALNHLRHESQNRYLWVDAICINQSDIEERNYQVGQMRSIYEDAAVVLMWLGEDGDDSHLAMDLLVRLESAGENWSDIARSPELHPHLVALSRLMQREYWERVWIIQEVVLTESPFVCCGRYGVMWATLALFLLIGEAWDHLSFSLEHYNIARLYGREGGAATLASLWFQKRLGLETPTISALMHSRRRHATDLHDYVFGIAGIAKNLPIKINYNVPVPILYQQLARNKILQDGSLEILSACYIFDPDKCRMTDHAPLVRKISGIQLQAIPKARVFEAACRMLGLTHDDALSITDPDLLREWERSWTDLGLDCLPSWIPRWDHLHVREWEFFYLHSRRSSDDEAAARLPPIVQFLSNDLELSVEGIFFDEVDLVGDCPLPPLDPDNLPSDGNSLISKFQDEWSLWVMAISTGHENPYGLLHDQQEAFRNTSVLGYFRRHKTLRSLRDGILNYIFGWEKGSPSSQSRQGGTAERVTHGVVTGLSHRFFITKSGYMGKGKSWVRPGDIVCVLYGGSVPYILRPVDTKYHFLGECYVHGIMDGEAVSMRSSGELQEQTFVLA